MLGLMSEPARNRVLDEEAVPAAIGHEEKTIEVPMGAIPEALRPEEPTVPVRTSLEKMLQHEMLRQRSAQDDGES
jgi:hypothetical protein